MYQHMYQQRFEHQAHEKIHSMIKDGCGNSCEMDANNGDNGKCIRSLRLPCIFILLNKLQASPSGKGIAPQSLSNHITSKSHTHFSLLYANRKNHIIVLVRVNR